MELVDQFTLTASYGLVVVGLAALCMLLGVGGLLLHALLSPEAQSYYASRTVKGKPNRYMRIKMRAGR